MIIALIVFIFLALLVIAMVGTAIILIIDTIATLPVLSLILLFVEHNYDKATERLTDLMSHHFILFPIITLAIIALCVSIGYYGRLGILMILSNVLASLVFEAGDVELTWYVFIPVGLLAVMLGLIVSRLVEPLIPCLASVKVQRITSSVIGVFGIFIGIFGYWFMGIAYINGQSDAARIIMTSVLSIVFTILCIFVMEKHIVVNKGN